MTNEDHDNLNTSNQEPGTTQPQLSQKSHKSGCLSTVGIVGALLFVVGLIVVPVLMSMASIFFPEKIPQEERYYHINQLLEEIDYETAGEILTESEYEGDGHPLSPIRYEVTFKGDKAFETLKTRILETVEVDCGTSDTTLVCGQGRPSITLGIASDQTVKLVLDDEGTGR